MDEWVGLVIDIRLPKSNGEVACFEIEPHAGTSCLSEIYVTRSFRYYRQQQTRESRHLTTATLPSSLPLSR